jgi:hypothetical protein
MRGRRLEPNGAGTIHRCSAIGATDRRRLFLGNEKLDLALLGVGFCEATQISAGGHAVEALNGERHTFGIFENSTARIADCPATLWFHLAEHTEPFGRLSRHEQGPQTTYQKASRGDSQHSIIYGDPLEIQDLAVEHERPVVESALPVFITALIDSLISLPATP